MSQKNYRNSKVIECLGYKWKGDWMLPLTVLCMARCGKSAMIFRRNRKIANCNEFRLEIQPQ